VKLPSGGSIVIETTEALTVIDVNSGKFTGGRNLDDTIAKTNVEAAAEIARQVRLRDIGGIIVCDFIDMSSENDRNKVIKTLEDGLRKDRTRSTIQSFSQLGLLEFTRKRVGKDLAGQLRSTCPTCTGLGSVMSPETVTISTFRQIADHQNGHADHVHVLASPQVAGQIEFWYEGELRNLSDKVGTPIDVRVDPAVHPEKPLVRWGNGLPELPPIRVGDELEVELLNMRLPVATSAAAVVNGRLIEVENAANAAGHTIRVRIIDVDGADILAEPRAPIPGDVAEDRKKRRRRGGRGRKPLTPAEQEEELRELAEEAEKGLGARPALGISTTEEAVAEERVAKNEGAPRHITPAVAVGDGAVEAPAAGERPRRGRRDGRDGRNNGRAPAAAPPPPSAPARSAPAAAASAGRPVVVTLPGESLSGTLVTKLPGETLSGDRVNELLVQPVAVAPVPVVAPVPAAAPRAESPLEAGAESGEPRRRRRRRRRGRGNGEAALGAAPAAAPGLVADDLEDDEEPGVAAVAAPAESPDGEVRRRRRRRRRRRGRGGAEAPAQTATGGLLPDRHIIRVDGNGEAHPTGETAPPAPNRALAPWNRPRKGEVALEPPPPVILAPVDVEPEMRVAGPLRRRGRRTAETADTVDGLTVKALPAPDAEPETPVRKPRARTTATATKAGPKKTVAKKTVAKKTVAKKTSAKKSTAKKAAPRKVTSAKKSTRKKTA
jgi:hypothetical protein